MAIYSLGAKGGPKRIDVSANNAKNRLQVGTVLRMEGYGNPKYVIVKNLGVNEKFGYGARYETVSLEDGRFGPMEDAYTMRWLAEKKDGRIAVYITDEVLAPDDVLDLYAKAQAFVAVDEAAKVQAAADFRFQVELLKAGHPELLKLSETNQNARTTAAKNIRKELAAKWPTVKFSVRSSTFSGGDSIDVSWMDGPTSEEVDKVADKYQGCDFDGMTDSTEHRHNAWISAFGNAKYVSCQRSLSVAALTMVRDEWGYTEADVQVKGHADGSGWLEAADYQKREEINRAAYAKDFGQEVA